MSSSKLITPGAVELRTSGSKLVAEGYAVVYMQPSPIGSAFFEQIAPGAGSASLLTSDVRACLNHDANMLLGRLSAGTLRLTDDTVGIRYSIDLPDTTVGRDVAEMLRRRDITGSSFSFRCIKDEWSVMPSGMPLRTITEMTISECGPVTFPAYSATTAALTTRAMQPQPDVPPSILRLVRF
jgi:HK97 family phage prohead protease